MKGVFYMETLNKKINARLLYRKLTALAINPEEIKVKNIQKMVQTIITYIKRILVLITAITLVVMCY